MPATHHQKYWVLYSHGNSENVAHTWKKTEFTLNVRPKFRVTIQCRSKFLNLESDRTRPLLIIWSNICPTFYFSLHRRVSRATIVISNLAFPEPCWKSPDFLDPHWWICYNLSLSNVWASRQPRGGWLKSMILTIRKVVSGLQMGCKGVSNHGV